MSGYSEIELELSDGVAVLTLNRPHALNALTYDMMYEVQDALAVVEADSDIRALILTGAGRGFCSGQDLNNRLPPGEDVVGPIMDCYFKAMNGLRTARVPVIVAVNGVAAGSGFSLALCGDIIMAARSARFIQVFSRIGLIPDCGSTHALPRAIGRTRALKAMMTNDPISAEQALDWGLITDCVDDTDLMDAARELAARLASGPTLALAETRRIVDEGAFRSFEDQFRAELMVQTDMRASHDAREGVAAFSERRAAKFEGR